MKFKFKIDWDNEFRYGFISVELIKKCMDLGITIQWKNISLNKNISINFIREFENDLDWDVLFQNDFVKGSEVIIREFIHGVTNQYHLWVDSVSIELI